MPRAGLDPEVVVRAAADLADTDGLEALTLARLAATLGVRSPSLYVHVDGLDDLRHRLAERAAVEFGDVLREATVGVSGAQAVRALANAYRGWALAHPGRYAALQPAADYLSAAAQRLVETVYAVLRGYGLVEAEAIHQTRALRAALHGFVTLEAGGGFGIDLDVDASFERLVTILESGLAAAARGPGPRGIQPGRTGPAPSHPAAGPAA
jgi:AcrR family transcriptional regulator